MTKLKQFRRTKNFIVVGVLNEENRLLHFTIADLNLERSTSERFLTANDAYEWAVLNYKALV